MVTFDAPGEKDFRNIAGKGQNTGNQHFLLFQQPFLPYQTGNAPYPHEPQQNCHLMDKGKFCYLVLG